MKKGATHEEDIRVIKAYISNNIALKKTWRKINRIKEQIEKPIIIVENFNNLFWETDRILRPKKKKKISKHKRAEHYSITLIYLTFTEHSTPRFFLKGNGNIQAHKGFYTNIYSSFISNSQNWEQTKCPSKSAWII